MKKTSIYFIMYFCSLATLQGQIEQQNFPGSKEINTKRATFNLEELKVRWKKAALENCPGVPCVTNSVPGDVTNIVVTDGLEEGEVIVTFTPPSDGGSPITEYEVEATEESAGVSSPTISSYSLKSVLIENITITSNDIPLTLAENTNEPVSSFVVSSIIRAKGSKSPITVKGLKVGVSYIFKVIAKNIFGSSPPTSSSKTNKFTPKVFACSAGAASSSPTLIQNTPLTNITHTTKKATGIGTATGLPSGVTANWSSNVITISGTPTAAGIFTYTIPLTGTSCSGVNATGTITVSAPPACGSITTVLDGDGNSYQTVGIGTQCWTKTNLKTTKYNDGVTAIPELTSNADWAAAITGALTVYGGSSPVTDYVSTYGYLYNWYAAAGIISSGGASTKNICPLGWHVPTDAEWTNLIQFIDPLAIATGSIIQSSTAGTEMKERSSLWFTDLGTNTSGFSALPGGFRFGFGPFQAISTNTAFWSATVNPSNNSWGRELVFADGSVVRDANLKSAGYSIRCLMN